MPPSNVVIKSSPEREHYYWTLTESMTSKAFEELNRKVTYAIGADKGKWALGTLLRVPGTTNYKYQGTPMVRVEKLEGGTYEPKHLDRALPLISATKEESKDRSQGTKHQGHKEEYGCNEEQPPVRLNNYGMRVWHGEQVKFKDDGQVDTSASLLLLGRVLHNGGATRSTIVEALRERDESLGWNKYTERDSDKEYQRIIDKLEESDRHQEPRARLQGAERNGTFSIGSRVCLGEVIQQGIKPPEELVQGILLKGKVHQVFAAPGCGKSWLALWLTKKLINEGKHVLYLDTENGPNIIADRLKALGVDPEKLDEYLHYHPSPNLPMTTEGVKAYVSLLEEINPVLVVFDSWVNFLSGAGLDENVSSDMES
jgi:hypothetical protein